MNLDLQERLKSMSIEKDYNQKINESLQLEAAGFTQEELEKMDKRSARIGNDPSFTSKEILEALITSSLLY